MLTLKRILKGSEARLSRAVCRLQSTGKGLVHACNVCGERVARFYSYGGRPFGCPFCKSSPRERLVVYCLDHQHLVAPGHSVLHVAPSEQGFIDRLGKGAGYSPVDLFPELYPRVNTQKLDLMHMDQVSVYDVVYLSHVMEHVPDDNLVLGNLYRSLRPGGQGWFLVPLATAPTVDGPELPAKEREKRFGQWDHVRQYGPDFADRIERAGFSVRVIRAADFPGEDCRLYGLNTEDWIFCGTKS